MVDFAAALDTVLDEVSKPKPMPEGLYDITVISKLMDKTTKKGTEYLEVTCSIDAARDDVDPAALEKVGKWQGRQMRATFYLTPDAMFRVKDFLKALGVSTSGRTLGEAIEEIENCVCVGQITQEISGKFDADGDAIIYANLVKFMPQD